MKKKTLLLDLGNSLAITEDGNIVKSIGNLALAYTNKMSDTIGCPDTWNPFGHIYFSDLGNYALTAGIFKIDVGEEDLRKSRVILAQVRYLMFLQFMVVEYKLALTLYLPNQCKSATLICRYVDWIHCKSEISIDHMTLDPLDK